MTELLNCPFCGEQPKFTFWKRVFPMVQCNCGASTTHGSNVQAAADAWNRRADGWIPYSDGDDVGDDFYMLTVVTPDGIKEQTIAQNFKGIWYEMGKAIPVNDAVTAYRHLPQPYEVQGE